MTRAVRLSWVERKAQGVGGRNRMVVSSGGTPFILRCDVDLGNCDQRATSHAPYTSV